MTIFIAGKLYDLTGSFHWSFYSAGAMLFLAGFICLPLRRIAKWKAKKDKMKRKSLKDGKKYQQVTDSKAEDSADL